MIEYTFIIIQAVVRVVFTRTYWLLLSNAIGTHRNLYHVEVGQLTTYCSMVGKASQFFFNAVNYFQLSFSIQILLWEVSSDCTVTSRWVCTGNCLSEHVLKALDLRIL